jgi:hypothetical protein
VINSYCDHSYATYCVIECDGRVRKKKASEPSERASRVDLHAIIVDLHTNSRMFEIDHEVMFWTEMEEVTTCADLNILNISVLL